MPDPTRQDSLNLLKNTRELENYYGNANKYTFRPEYSQSAPLLEDPLSVLRDKRNEFDARYEGGNPTAIVQKNGRVKGFVLEPSYYYKDLPGDNFQQREVANSVLNINAPMARYNTKIAPTEHRNYLGMSSAELGGSANDNVDIFGYDPLAITPADMQSDFEIIKRVNKHGPSGVPASRLKALGLLLPKEPVPKVSEASKKRKENRDLLNQQLKEAGLYNRATGITARNPEASRMYEEYMRSKQPSQPSVTQVPNQVQSAGEVIKQPIEERIPEGYQLNLGYRGADGRYYGNTYNPTTSKGETYPVPGAPTMEDYKRIRAAELNPKRTGTRTVRADFAYGGTPPTDPPYNLDSTPTKADSLFLLNNNKVIKDMQKGEWEKQRNKITADKYKNWLKYYTDATSTKKSEIQKEIDAYKKGVATGGWDKDGFISKKGKMSDYYSDKGLLKGATDWLTGGGEDKDFAMQYIHPNIKPNFAGEMLKPTADKGEAPAVYSYAYDDLAITPWSMLNESERKERLKKYGVSGTPFDTSITKKPRSASSLAREEARNILKKDMAEVGFTKYTPRQVLKKGSKAEKAYQEHIGKYTKKEETPKETPKETVTPKKEKVELPEGYSYRQDDTRDGDMNDYFLGNKRISREEFIKATGYKPTQFRERTVKIPEFRDGGPINNDGPLAQPQGDIYLPLDGTRPSYIDASGKERSEYKIGVGTKEGEMVIPTVWNGEQHTEDEAIDRYYNTGEHMGGPYGSIEEGERAAKLRTFLYNEHPAYSKKAYGGRVVDKNVTKDGYGKTGYKDVTYRNIFGQDVHKRTEYDGQDIKKTKTKKSDNKEVSEERNFWGGEGYDRTKEVNKINNRGDIISNYEYNQSIPQQSGNFGIYDLKTKTVLGADGSYDYKEKEYNSGRALGHRRTNKRVHESEETFAYGGCAPKYAQGGQLYEAEGGEVIDGGNPITLQGGHISPNSSNSGKIVGNSHGNGGVKMTGGEKIYSDRLTVDTSFLKDLDI